MRLTLVVQGIKGSGGVPIPEASVLFIRGLLIDGQEVSVKRCTVNFTPQEFLSVDLEDVVPHNGGFTEEQMQQAWETEEDVLRFGPMQIDFKEYQT